MGQMTAPGISQMSPDWLAQLAPAHAPPPPGAWPLAPGWWGLAALMLVIVAVVSYWQFRGLARLRRLALRQLKALEVSATDDVTLARDLQNLMRRYAIKRFGRDEVSNLTGERWLAFAIAHGATAWAGETGTRLLRAAYRGTVSAGSDGVGDRVLDPALDRVRWLQGARAFLRFRPWDRR